MIQGFKIESLKKGGESMNGLNWFNFIKNLSIIMNDIQGEEIKETLITTEAWIAIISGIVALLTLIVTIIAVKKRS